MKRLQGFRYLGVALILSAAGMIPGGAAPAAASVKTAKSSKAKEGTGSPSEAISATQALIQAENIHDSVLGSDEFTRLTHARELLGRSYKKSLIAKKEAAELKSFIKFRLSSSLKNNQTQASRKLAKRIYKTILEESNKHAFDPVFLLAVIENESSFNIKAVGTSGEIGLMQIMPDTGEWIAKKLGMTYRGKKTLEDPIANIRIGSAYLAHLRQRFDAHSQLYLAAYNMGQGNVVKALSKEIYPKQYASRVMQRYLRFYSELAQRRPADDGKKLN